MTSEEYYAEIKSIAQSIYDDYNIPEWLAAHTLDLLGGREPYFREIIEEESGDDSLSEALDAYFQWTTIQEAATVIAATKTNPDHVDHGLYEGAGVRQMFVCIAFQCYEWDVDEEIERLYKEDFERAVGAAREEEASEDSEDSEDNVNSGAAWQLRPYPTTARQIGYYPKLRRFSHYRCAYDTNLGGQNKRETHFFIVGAPDDFSLSKKVISPTLYLCIEGSGVMTENDTWIDAKRVYLQNTGGSDEKGADEQSIAEVLRDALFDGLVDHGWADELGPLPESERPK